MYLSSYLRSAEEIVNSYSAEMPFAAWLKGYFRQHKKFGSKDRRLVSDLCFCYYRLGKAFDSQPTEERLLIGQFLCHTKTAFITELKPTWAEYLSLSVLEKISFLHGKETVELFPFWNEVSNDIDASAFALSHLTQPDLFLRIRPRQEKMVIQKLQEAALSFSLESDCVRLPNASKIETIINVDEEVVVQDKSSQQVLNGLKEQWEKTSFTTWDCCAASGGKSILLLDHFPKASLTVSDIRESILHNLRSRFKRAGIFSYHSFVADVSASSFHLNKKFDVVICDAPCSGSGTWGRTPEQLQFFTQEKIDHYANLQKAISANASGCLNTGGAFVYITCSVFKKENEEVVAHLLQHTNLQLQQQQYVKGYTEKADTLFVALFTL